ncbi:hypothetical protein JCM5296_001281 [Sporobolomyces johnsonii]
MPLSDRARETNHVGEAFESGSTKPALASAMDYLRERTDCGLHDDRLDWEWWSGIIKHAISRLDSDIVDVFEGNVTRGEAAKDKTDKKWYERSANQLYTLMLVALGNNMKAFEDLEGEEIYPEFEMRCGGCAHQCTNFANMSNVHCVDTTVAALSAHFDKLKKARHHLVKHVRLYRKVLGNGDIRSSIISDDLFLFVYISSLPDTLLHFAFYEHMEGNNVEVLHESLIARIKNFQPSPLSWWD